MVQPAATPETRPRSSGVYGLLRLDGAPVALSDARAMGFAWASEACARPTPAFLIEGHDSYAPGAIHRLETEGTVTLLVGDVAEPAQRALQLGLAAGAPVAEIARAALARYGTETPAFLLGEWSLLHLDAQRSLTLMVGAAMRDRLLYSTAGTRVAVAPDLFRLARIDWIGSELNAAGLLFSLGRDHLRRGQGQATVCARVNRIEPGGSVLLRPDGRLTRAQCAVLTEQPRWHGEFGDAVSAAEDLLRRIMRERLLQTTLAAPLLSGGLDSSLLAWLAARERPTGHAPLLLTSTAPPDSGIDDESEFAALVAERLGLENLHVYPAPQANSYRPTDEILTGNSGPILSNRHCLTDAFQIAARARGVSLLVNGTYGEMSATARLPAISARHRMRVIAAQLLNRLRRREHSAAAFAGVEPFHVRLALHRLNALPAAICEAIEAPDDRRWDLPADGTLGYIAGIEKALSMPNEFFAGAIRMDYPFRDVRLLRLFAGFPVRMLLTGGHDRPVVRHLLKGHLPDSIRLRRRGMPASPDHMARLQWQAAGARQRIGTFRQAGIDDWLDLDWLDQTLASVSERGVQSVQQANEVQLTAMAAEFLLCWQTRF